MSADRTFHVVEAIVDGDEAGATVRRRWSDDFKERAVTAARRERFGGRQADGRVALAVVRVAPTGPGEGPGGNDVARVIDYMLKR